MAAAVTKSRSKFCYSIVSYTSVPCLSSVCVIFDQQNEHDQLEGSKFGNQGEEDMSSCTVTLHPQWSEEQQL